MDAPKIKKERPRAFAIVKDGRRRGGLRVVRVAVVLVWEEISAASVEEIAGAKTPHFLPFARLSSRGGATLREKFRTASKQAADASNRGELPGASEKKTPGPIDAPVPWYRREPEDFAGNAPQTDVAAPAVSAAT